MAHRRTRVSEPRGKHTITARLAVLDERLDAMERRHRQLRNTVAALGRESGISLGSPCSHCEESYTLVKDGFMYCPHCGHRRTI